MMQYNTISTSGSCIGGTASILYKTDDPRIQELEKRLADLEEKVENLWMATNIRDLL